MVPQFGTGTSGLLPVLVHKDCVDRIAIRAQEEIRAVFRPNGLTLLLLIQQQEFYRFQSDWDTGIHFHSGELHAGRWEELLVLMLSAVCWYTGACSCANQSFLWHGSFMYPCFVCERNVCQAFVWQSWRQKCVLGVCLGAVNSQAVVRCLPGDQRAGLRHWGVFTRPVNPIRL